MSLEGFRFHDPLWLLALAPSLAVVVLAWRRQRRHALGYSDLSRFSGAPRSLVQRARSLLPWLDGLALALLVVGLARPQEGRAETRVKSEGVAIQMVVDRSGSMRALDFEVEGRRVNRLEAVKHVFRRFVGGDGDSLRGRPDDLIGLIAFAGYAETKTPLTFDHAMLVRVLDELRPAGGADDQRLFAADVELLRESQQTAIGDALAAAVLRLRGAPAKSKVLILLSDGGQTTGALSPEEGAALAKAAGIKVHTIAIGRDGPVPMEQIDPFGRTQVALVRMPPDRETLARIAAATGGEAFHAEDTSALAEVYAAIDRLERTELERTIFTSYDERAGFALAPALALLALHTLLSATVLRRLP